MAIPDVVAFIRGELAKRSTDAHREGLCRYFKEPVDPYGVRAADIRKIEQQAARIVRKWPAADRNKLCGELMKSGRLEESMIVVYLYSRFAKQCAACEYKLFERWIDRHTGNWATCDGIASKLVASCLANEPALIGDLTAWTASKNRWKRRAAAVSLTWEARKGRHSAAIFALAARLMLDDDEMVQKGTGWLLKETYPPHPRETVEFLLKWNDRAPRLTLRYAAEKMTAADKARVLGR
jgi:3-methyladenine DNA glycosylase AlkD